MILVTGCTGTDQASDAAAEGTATATGTPGSPGNSTPDSTEPSAETSADGSVSVSPSEPAAEAPSPSESGPPATGPVPHRISVPALIRTRYRGGGLRVGQVLAETDAYTRYAVRYRSQGLRISGIMNVPAGGGPFPVLVLNHGYIEPEVYVTGQGLAREQDWLARRGYVVLHTDYRGHASSDDDPSVDHRLRLPYAIDVLNAVRAVQRSDLPYLDGERVGLLGRSMGGNVTLNALVARPAMVDAAVVYASTSSLAADNWRQFYRGAGDRAQVNARMQRTYGLPRQSPGFWRAASPRPYFDRVRAPLLMHHGTADDTCPPAWSRATVRALHEAGKRARLVEYEGEGHTMYAQWERSMRRTHAFFRRHLRS
jgi:dipeptidyl aminopeptidase/acylaminoacyl peptidase